MSEDEAEAEKEKTILVAVDGDRKRMRLLPYTLANVEELVEITFYLLSSEIIPEDLKAEILSALEPLKLQPVTFDSNDRLFQDAPGEEKLVKFLKAIGLA